jgi:hypothetical protein
MDAGEHGASHFGMMTGTVSHLGSEYGLEFLEGEREQGGEFAVLYQALEERGLMPQPERAHLFSVYSPESRQSIAIAIMPFSSRDQTMEGGLSTARGHSQAVIVHLEDRVDIRGFETLAVVNGQLEQSKFDAYELRERGARRIAERHGKVKAAQHLIEITPYQAKSMATTAYNSLLSDNFSRSVHSREEIMALRANTNIVSEIAAMVLFRTSGSACCSCSCSCWGSSSCSCSYVG